MIKDFRTTARKTTKHYSLYLLLPVAVLTFAIAACAMAQTVPGRDGLDRVMSLADFGVLPDLPQDQGSPGLWQKLLKLTTTASAIHTTAHPDDENGGTLAYLSRGKGVRLALLTLNRGESGANAIGPELFDGLGIIRTEELLLSDRYYGLDDQYHTTVIDYGFSKSLDEALDKWGRENVLRDMVRVIRINRPLVIISRFHGSERDGHGNHQTAGVISQEAFDAAGDPNKFPEQITREGLRPWQPLKMYRGGMRPQETWTLQIDSGEFSPWLGTSYRQFASRGLAYQRSQNGGRMRENFGESLQRYERLYSKVDAPARETGFFDGIDTSITGIYSIVGGTPPPNVPAKLAEIADDVSMAMDAYNVANPSAVVPYLAKGLAATREAVAAAGDSPDAVFMLRIKERQFEDAINCALGIRFRALAIPGDAQIDSSPWSSLPTMGLVVPGQRLQVTATLANGSEVEIRVTDIGLRSPRGWKVRADGGSAAATLSGTATLNRLFHVNIAANAAVDDRYFYRDSIQDPRYKMRDERYRHLPRRTPDLTAYAGYTVEGVPVEAREIVHTLESDLPYGTVERILEVGPDIAVNVSPEMRVVPLASADKKFTIQVELINNRDAESSGRLRLELPDGWKSDPASHNFRFARAGERVNLAFSVEIPQLESRDYTVKVVAEAGGQRYARGYQTIRHRDLETRYIYRDSVATVRGIDVAIAADLSVGYVMGVGDEVPEGISQLGASVELLGQDDLATGDLSRFDDIVVGTRAYAVRPDLITYNQRLLDFAKAGGNLIVLYNTQEFKPEKWAAYTAGLPRGAEEVSEEDSPVKILAPDHPVFQSPNKITAADFDGWVEQRGSKFFATWDKAYTAMIETQDRRQEPQQGGWVTAKYGEGYYTYFAYAFHRQSPYGVPGAYRIFANLLSLGK